MVFEKTLLSKAMGSAFDMPVEVTYWDGKTERYGDGEPEAKIKFNKKFSFNDISSQPTLVLAEAYMNEDIEIEGSIQELIVSAYRKRDSFLTDQSGLTGKIAKRLMGSHTQKDSREDIHSHYDIGNDFYKKWLDPTMTYSCAYFANDEMSLEEAQIAKVHHILNKLNSQPGGRLLDIGCGWGTLVITAAQEYGLNAVGITLSDEQFYFARRKVEELGLQDKVEIKLIDYRDLKDEQFDYITSVGMFEHVGKENLAMYFNKVAEYLKPNGRALIHGITGQHYGMGVDPFIEKYIFPGGYIPNVAEQVTHIMEAGLQLDDLEPLRRHYQKTLEIWDENYLKVFDETIDEMGKPFARMWDLYLQACAAGFESGNIDVMQFLMTKGAAGQGLPMTRDYIYKK
ncbi:SAM-dependent methyltransferase [Lactococcus termiticola]|uniref:Cyclopropane-fatty-acyl-phospholipid synthase n=1 Tax=Lactococcus termiticola TaxID=2169526 RepID=A0A2R5HGR6_9LACT|nr:cyclopropane-fatty-acyl-phospholipid synthase family protein [Lactococcus termiticola]GBG97253.1 cyclopropane-fatty-acyl-phospholipid synthase [Lactococcus termiticola]